MPRILRVRHPTTSQTQRRRMRQGQIQDFQGTTEEPVGMTGKWRMDDHGASSDATTTSAAGLQVATLEHDGGISFVMLMPREGLSGPDQLPTVHDLRHSTTSHPRRSRTPTNSIGRCGRDRSRAACPQCSLKPIGGTCDRPTTRYAASITYAAAGTARSDGRNGAPTASRSSLLRAASETIRMRAPACCISSAFLKSA